MQSVPAPRSCRTEFLAWEEAGNNRDPKLSLRELTLFGTNLEVQAKGDVKNNEEFGSEQFTSWW